MEKRRRVFRAYEHISRQQMLVLALPPAPPPYLHPLGAKLGVPQKISYLLIPILIIVMFYTGLCLWAPTMDLGFFAAGTNLVGGLMSMRIIHYFMMYVFIVFMFIHIYLANIEGISPTLLMFFWKEHGGLVYDPEKHTIVGEDDLRH